MLTKILITGKQIVLKHVGNGLKGNQSNYWKFANIS